MVSDDAGDHVRDVSAEALCAGFHKAFQWKRNLMPRAVFFFS
jgi:hypothetical protein